MVRCSQKNARRLCIRCTSVRQTEQHPNRSIARSTFKYLNHDYWLLNILARSIWYAFRPAESRRAILSATFMCSVTGRLGCVSIACICRRTSPDFGASAKVIGTWRIVSSGVLNYRSTRAKVCTVAWPVKNIVSWMGNVHIYIYVYVYIKREGERKRGGDAIILTIISAYSLIDCILK